MNVLWGFANFVIAYLLIARVGTFELRAADHIIAVGVGVLLIGVMAAWSFGRFHGGNSPRLVTAWPGAAYELPASEYAKTRLNRAMATWRSREG